MKDLDHPSNVYELQIQKGDNEMEELLNPLEKESLAELEDIIQKHLSDFYDVGIALMQIRDGQFYRENYSTFEAYCRAKWGMSKPRAYQLIKAAGVQDNLSTIVDKPINEAQIRPLTRLSSPERQAQAYRRAVQTAPEGVMTAAHVNKVVEEMKEESKKERTRNHDNENVSSTKSTGPVTSQFEVVTDDGPRNNKNVSSTAIDLANAAIAQLGHIHDDDPRMEEALSLVEKWISDRRRKDKTISSCTLSIS